MPLRPFFRPQPECLWCLPVPDLICKGASCFSSQEIQLVLQAVDGAFQLVESHAVLGKRDVSRLIGRSADQCDGDVCRVVGVAGWTWSTKFAMYRIEPPLSASRNGGATTMKIDPTWP